MRTRITASRVLPDSSRAFAPGAVVVDGERIEWVGPADVAPAADVEIDLADAVLTPGLVNAHSHLDLTHMRGQVPYRGDFAAWLSGIIGTRKEIGVGEAALWGIKEALARGTSTFGDIASPKTFPAMLEAFGEAGARGRIFVEAIGFRPELADGVLDRVRELVETKALPPRTDTGISPHAPYSVSRELFQRAVAVADGHERPLAVHVAETLEELAFLRHGIGPLRELLKEHDADNPGHEPYGSVPGFLGQLDLRQAPLLLVHGNYLRPRDVPAGAFVVHCPTAHRFFDHPEHPVLEMLEEGVRVALGSDGAVSGETVDLLSETQFLARARVDLQPKAVFRMATEWGARALGFDAGLLEPGKLADLAAFVPEAGHEILGMEEAHCIFTMVGGHVLYTPE